MTASDNETLPEQSRGKSGKNNKSTPSKSKESAGKQTIKTEKKKQKEPAEPTISGIDMIITPVRNPQKGKQTIKPARKVKKAPNAASISENSIEKATERKPKKAVKKPMKQDKNKESKAPVVTSEVGPSIKVSPVRSKAKPKLRKGRPKVKTKRKNQSPRGIYYRPKAMRKEFSKSKPEETKGNVAAQRISNKAKRRGKNRMQQSHIPFVPPFQHRVGVARGPLKYRLQRAETNSKHRQRVKSNRRVNRRRVKSTKKKDFGDYGNYGVDFWDKPKVNLFDLSSIECGSYDDKVDLGEDNSTLKPEASGKFPQMRKQRTEVLEWGNSKDFRGLDDLNIPADFAFNPSAPVFIPQKTTEKKSVIFTLEELLKSVKGKELPTMPALKPFVKSK